MGSARAAAYAFPLSARIDALQSGGFMRLWIRRLALAALVVTVGAPVRGEDTSEAERLYQAKDWAAAGQAYAALARQAPKNPQYAFRQGACLMNLGKSREALPFFETASTLGFPPPLMQAWSARALARAGDRDAAFAFLEKATLGGLVQVSMLDTDPDFASLRSDPRFAAIRAAADRNAHPCAHAPEYRQLDFWVGDWDVTASGAVAGESHVERMLEGCVVYENWTGASGVTGKSFNIWDATTKEWRQTWVDSTGTLTEFHGSLVDGNMVYRAHGLTPGPDGKLAETHQRMTFFDQKGTVRQLGELSNDEGTTWRVSYDLLYTRKPAP
jgi:hypothetical protein